MKNGGRRPGAGGKNQFTNPGPGIARQVFAEEMAAEVRRRWKAAKPSGTAGPKPNVNDVRACVRWVLNRIMDAGEMKDIKALGELLDRILGRAVYPHEHGGPDGRPIAVEHSGGLTFSCIASEGDDLDPGGSHKS